MASLSALCAYSTRPVSIDTTLMPHCAEWKRGSAMNVLIFRANALDVGDGAVCGVAVFCGCGDGARTAGRCKVAAAALPAIMPMAQVRDESRQRRYGRRLRSAFIL